MGKLERYPKLFLVLGALYNRSALVETTNRLDLLLSHLCLRSHLHRGSSHLLRHHDWILIAIWSTRLHLLLLRGTLRRGSIVLCLRHKLLLLLMLYILALIRPSTVHRLLLLLPKLAHMLVLLLLPGLAIILSWSLIVLHIKLLIISN